MSASASGALVRTGLRCHFGRSWMRPTGAQDPSRQARRGWEKRKHKLPQSRQSRDSPLGGGGPGEIRAGGDSSGGQMPKKDFILLGICAILRILIAFSRHGAVCSPSPAEVSCFMEHTIKQKAGGGWRNNYFLKAFFLGLGAVLPHLPALSGGGRGTVPRSTGTSTSNRCPSTAWPTTWLRNGQFGVEPAHGPGGDFIGSYSFYLLGSPFFWLTIPFPSEWLQFLMGPLLILKFACATLTGYVYLHRYTKTRDTALLGAVLYAFSGFSIYNVFFNHFHEAIVFFPLLLAALDEYMAARRRGLFALAVCLLLRGELLLLRGAGHLYPHLLLFAAGLQKLAHLPAGLPAAGGWRPCWGWGWLRAAGALGAGGGAELPGLGSTSTAGTRCCTTRTSGTCTSSSASSSRRDLPAPAQLHPGVRVEMGLPGGLAAPVQHDGGHRGGCSCTGSTG